MKITYIWESCDIVGGKILKDDSIAPRHYMIVTTNLGDGKGDVYSLVRTDNGAIFAPWSDKFEFVKLLNLSGFVPQLS